MLSLAGCHQLGAADALDERRSSLLGSWHRPDLRGCGDVCRIVARHEAALSPPHGVVVGGHCAEPRGVCDGIGSVHHVQHWPACGRFADVGLLGCAIAFSYRGRLRQVGLWMVLYILISSIIPVVSFLLVGPESGLANLPMEIPTIAVIVIYAWMQRRVLIPNPADTAKA